MSVVFMYIITYLLKICNYTQKTNWDLYFEKMDL